VLEGKRPAKDGNRVTDYRRTSSKGLDGTDSQLWSEGRMTAISVIFFRSHRDENSSGPVSGAFAVENLVEAATQTPAPSRGGFAPQRIPQSPTRALSCQGQYFIATRGKDKEESSRKSHSPMRDPSNQAG